MCLLKILVIDHALEYKGILEEKKCVCRIIIFLRKNATSRLENWQLILLPSTSAIISGYTHFFLRLVHSASMNTKSTTTYTVKSGAEVAVGYFSKKTINGRQSRSAILRLSY